MNKAMDILATILPVFLAIGLGALCRARGIISREGMDALKKVAVNITLPAVTLSAFAQADYSSGNLLVPVWIFFCCCVALLLGYAVQRVAKLPGKLSPFLCTGFEGGMLGFALYPMLYGTLAPFAIVDMGQILFVFTVYKMLLSGAKGPRGLVREAAASPVLWALLAGAIIGASGLYGALAPSGIKDVLDATLSFISGPTSFLILLTVGYDLRPSQIQWRRTVSVVLARLVIMGLLLGATLLLNRYVLGGVIEPGAAILLFLLPAPFVVTVFADDPQERGFLSSALSVMTCITVLAFTVMVFVAR